ncbi:MAG: FecR domain-containing protein, partial [Balneolaceae bacterium]
TLDGEAFFDADSGTKKNPVFAVTTPDGTIKDIGTQFLVSVQNKRSRVVLQDGYVEVEYSKFDWKDQERKTFNVKKGELVEFSRTSILKKEKVNASFYTSWATDFLEFDQTKIGDFTKYMEQYF